MTGVMSVETAEIRRPPVRTEIATKGFSNIGGLLPLNLEKMVWFRFPRSVAMSDWSNGCQRRAQWKMLRKASQHALIHV